MGVWLEDGEDVLEDVADAVADDVAELVADGVGEGEGSSSMRSWTCTYVTRVTRMRRSG